MYALSCRRSVCIQRLVLNGGFFGGRGCGPCMLSLLFPLFLSNGGFEVRWRATHPRCDASLAARGVGGGGGRGHRGVFTAPLDFIYISYTCRIHRHVANEREHSGVHGRPDLDTASDKAQRLFFLLVFARPSPVRRLPEQHIHHPIRRRA